jgi:hypothetical protein
MLILFPSLPAGASFNPRFEMEAGFKTVITAESSDHRAYYKPFLVTGCRTDYFGIFAVYGPYCNYQIFNALGDSRAIVLHKILGDIEITPVAGFYAGFEFACTLGEASYFGTEYIVEAGYDFSTVSLFAEFSYSSWKYCLDGVSIRNWSYDIFGEVSYYVIDTVSIDLSYDHLYYYSAELYYDLRKNVFRAGAVAGFREMIFIMGGVTLGWTGDFFITGCDAGINIYPWKYIKISVLYVYSYSKNLYAGTYEAPSDLSFNSSPDAHRFSIGLSYVMR